MNYVLKIVDGRREYRGYNVWTPEFSEAVAFAGDPATEYLSGVIAKLRDNFPGDITWVSPEESLLHLRLVRVGTGGVGFFCPACQVAHQFVAGYTLHIENDAPTIEPDIVVMNGDDVGLPERCHVRVLAGHLYFFPDSTHVLAGDTVPMLAIPAPLRSA